MNSVKSVIINFESMTDNRKWDILLYGDSRFDENWNKIILEATINYLKNSERFSGSFFWVIISWIIPINTNKPETIKPLLVWKIAILYYFCTTFCTAHFYRKKQKTNKPKTAV